MNTYVRYAAGICLQVVGLLNAVFLVGVPIWLAGRRLCRDARADERSSPLVGRSLADGSVGPARHDHDPNERGYAADASRSERRVPLRRN